MTNVEFLEVTREIEKYYEKELKAEESRIWFEELKNIPKERYRQITRECYKTLKFMPKLPDIIEKNKTIPSEEKKNNTVYGCSRCKGVGLIIYTKVQEEYPYQYAVRCNCKNSLKMSKKIPTTDEVGITL